MLYNRYKNIVTVMEQVDAVNEITYVNQALSKCGYSKWAFKRVKQQIDQKAAEPKKKRTAKKDQAVTKTSITIPT